MVYDFKGLQQKIVSTEEWLKKEFQSIRTGQATPSLLDGIQVESYGARVPINQIGSVTVEDPRTLRVVPWNVEQVKDVKKAITDANLGLGISTDEQGVRVSFPDLTSERRESLVKLAKDKLEQSRVSLRNERDNVWSDIQKKAQDGEISEDDKFRYKDELQKLIDDGNSSLDKITTRKEEEIKR